MRHFELAYHTIQAFPYLYIVYNRYKQHAEITRLFESDSTEIWNHHIFSGSFNPLHEGHLAIWNSIEKGYPKAFEISITNYDKPPIEYNDLLQRLEYFKDIDANIFITNAPKFRDKIRVLGNVNFHIGYDTATRLANDENVHELAAEATLTVYPRKISGRLYDFNSRQWPTFMFGEFVEGTLKNKNHIHISSSLIRRNHERD